MDPKCRNRLLHTRPKKTLKEDCPGQSWLGYTYGGRTPERGSGRGTQAGVNTRRSEEAIAGEQMTFHGRLVPPVRRSPLRVRFEPPVQQLAQPGAAAASRDRCARGEGRRKRSARLRIENLAAATGQNELHAVRASVVDHRGIASQGDRESRSASHRSRRTAAEGPSAAHGARRGGLIGSFRF